MMDDNIQVIFNGKGNYLLVLGDRAVEISRQEAEQLFVDLGHALQDHDLTNQKD